MSDKRVLSAYCRKTNKYFALEVSNASGDWEAVNFVELTEEQALTLASGGVSLPIISASSLLPCSRCGSRNVFGCSCARKAFQCAKSMKYNFQCLYCDQASLLKFETAMVMLVMDVSGSMAGVPLEKAKEAAANMVSQMDTDCIKVGLVSFSTEIKTILYPTNDKSMILQAIASLKAEGNTSEPLTYVLNGIQAGGLKVFIVLLTDGLWNDTDKAIAQAEKAKNLGYEIFAIGLGGVNKEFLEKIATSKDLALLTDPASLAKSFAGIGQRISDSVLNIKLP